MERHPGHPAANGSGPLNARRVAVLRIWCFRTGMHAFCSVERFPLRDQPLFFVWPGTRRYSARVSILPVRPRSSVFGLFMQPVFEEPTCCRHFNRCTTRYQAKPWRQTDLEASIGLVALGLSRLRPCPLVLLLSSVSHFQQISNVNCAPLRAKCFEIMYLLCVKLLYYIYISGKNSTGILAVMWCDEKLYLVIYISRPLLCEIGLFLVAWPLIFGLSL